MKTELPLSTFSFGCDSRVTISRSHIQNLYAKVMLAQLPSMTAPRLASTGSADLSGAITAPGARSAFTENLIPMQIGVIA